MKALTNITCFFTPYTYFKNFYEQIALACKNFYETIKKIIATTSLTFDFIFTDDINITTDLLSIGSLGPITYRESSQTFSETLTVTPLTRQDLASREIATINSDEFAFIRNIPIINEYLQPSISSIIKQILHTEIDVTSRQWYRKEIMEFESVLSPKLQLMETITAHYKEKYQIEIYTIPWSRILEFFKNPNLQNNAFGIIFYLDNTPRHQEEGHVTPYLINFLNGKKQILNLDSTGNNPDIFYGYRDIERLQKTDSKIELLYSLDGRQADQFSCRTDALTILRNALLDIKRNQMLGNLIDLTTLTELSTSLSKHDCVASYVKLPSSWTYFAQILSKETNLDSLMIRDFFSKKSYKQANPRTVHNFRAYYNQPIHFLESITLTLTSMSLFNFKELAERISEKVTSLKIEGNRTVYYYKKNNPTHLKFDIITTKSAMVYLSVKGYRNFHSRLPSSPSNSFSTPLTNYRKIIIENPHLSPDLIEISPHVKTLWRLAEPISHAPS